MTYFTLSGLFIGLANLFCSYWVAEAFLDKRQGSMRRWHLPYLLMLTAVYLAIHSGLGAAGVAMPLALRFGLNLMVTAAVLTAVLNLFSGSFVRKLFVTAVLFALLAIGQVLYMTLATSLGAPDDLVMGQGDVGVCVVQVILTLAVKGLRRRRRALQGGGQLYLIQSVIPLLTVLLLWMWAYAGMHTAFSMFDILSFICVLLINFVLYYVFEAMEAAHAQRAAYALQEQRHTLLETYYQKMEEHQREVRSIKHDLTNQLMALGAYIDGDNRQMAAGQIDALIGRLADTTAHDFTAHPGVNALLGAKYRQAQAAGITCEFDVKMPGDIDIEANDLSALIGNVLDNAIEACLHCSGQRYVRLTIAFASGALILRCENSTDGKSRTLESRKGDAINHGLGMGNIRRIVDNYGGDMQHSFGPNSFAIDITLFETPRHPARQNKT